MKTKLTLLAVSILALQSCASLESYITKQPIQTTPVQRENGIPFNVATSDIIRAEQQPQKVWALYDTELFVNRESSK